LLNSDHRSEFIIIVSVWLR